MAAPCLTKANQDQCVYSLCYHIGGKLANMQYSTQQIAHMNNVFDSTLRRPFIRQANESSHIIYTGKRLIGYDFCGHEQFGHLEGHYYDQ